MKCNTADSVEGGTQAGRLQFPRADVSIWQTRWSGIEPVNQAAGAIEGCALAHCPVLGTKSRALLRTARDSSATWVTLSAGEDSRRWVRVAPVPIVVCAALVLGGLASCSPLRLRARRGSRCRGATLQVPMSSAKQTGAAVNQPGSRRWVLRGVARRGRGESACDVSGWRIGRPSGV